MPAVILVCGEALIDLVPSPPVDGNADGAIGPAAAALMPRLGGGPFNTAVALGRLGVPTGFVGRLSRDGFGQRLRAALESSGVDLGLAVEGAEPTSLAVVQLTPRGDAQYSFYVEGTADAALGPDDVPATLPPGVRACHFGTLSLVLEPEATTLEGFMAAAHAAGAVVALDPNVRSALIADPDAYRRRLDGWLRHCDLVKVSADDVTWLYPGASHRDVLARWRAAGPAVVVVTDGPAGATAIGPDGIVAVPAPAVRVVDTIGAGDAFNAGLLAWLDHHHRLQRAALGTISGPDLTAAITHAAHVAAIACTRAGADPPWRCELDAALLR